MDGSAPSVARRRSTWLQLGGLWLALLIVLGNALDPVGPALEAPSGSAFNAFTSDVSLGPARNQEPAKARAANDRDRDLRHSGGGGLALLPAPTARILVATLDLPPTGRITEGLPAQGPPRTHDARAPPRA